MQDDPTSVCLFDDQIEAAARGSLDDPSARLHLERCPRCRAAADAVRSDDEFLARLERAGAVAPAPVRPELPPAVPGYRILGEIKRGGQGVVYEAVQIATERKVALKVPLRGVGAMPDQLLRFRREARLAAAIDHPNVAVIHAVEFAGGQPVQVFEFVPGEGLAERLGRGPLPVAEALEVARQLALGIGAAHERGVIHRDLKPSNVKMTPGGTVKILDFGLARSAVQPAGAGAPDDRTLAGAVVGTPRYMSPEQARGAPVDPRTDVFSWACLVFECLAGAPAFAGDSPSECFAAILTREPEWTRLPEQTPESVRALLARCLQKDPARRLADIAEARAEIERAMEAREWEHPERPRPPPPPGTRTNLPGELTSFIGRHRELAEVKHLLASSRLLTLTGAGGCGKTRLALRVARDLLDAFPDGVRLVEFAALADGALVPQAAAAALDVREEPRSPLTETLAASLRDKSALIVLDNCEHVLRASSTLVETILRSCPAVKILTTSREPLGIAGERSWRVPSLSMPEPPAEGGASAGPSSEAVRLFADRASAVSPSFALTGENGGAIAQICRRLDGIPLAIELAAARVRVMSVHQVAARLDDRFRLLTGGSRSAVPRQRTLAALIDWSYDLLTEPERALLRRLSVFAGGWTLEAAGAVSPGDEYETLDLLTMLVDKSLVIADDSPKEKRYRMLETVRQYAADRLLAAPQRDESVDARDRHAAWYLGLAERAEMHLQGRDQGAWLARLELEHDNLRTAWDWLATRPAGGTQILSLGGALWRFWVTRGHLTESRRRLAEALARPDTSAPTAARAKALSGAGTAAWGQADFAAATDLLSESLRIRRELNDRSGVAASLNNLGLVAADAGGPDAARAMYEESLRIRRELNDKAGEAAVLNNLGLLEYRAGRYAAARDLHERSLAIKRQTQDRRAIAYSLGNLAYVALAEGEAARARDLAEECLAISRETGDQRGMAEAIELLGSQAAAGTPARAVRLYAAADALRRAIGAPPPAHERAEHLRRLAAASAAVGDAAFAAHWNHGLAMTLEDAITLATDRSGDGR